MDVTDVFLKTGLAVVFEVLVLFHSIYRLVGLAVKASASRAEDPGFESYQ